MTVVAARWLRALGRVVVYAAGAAALLAVALAVTASLLIRGERFGRVVERALPETRGAIHIGGGAWSWQALLALPRGRPARLELADVRITDPEGTEVLRARRISGVVELGGKPLRAVIRDLRVEGAAWRFGDMKSHRGIGFLAALEPVARRRPPRARPPGARGGGLFIEGARLEGLDATFDFADWGLVLHDVHGDASLSLKADVSPAETFRFDVRGAVAGGGGQLRVGSRSAAWTLPFSVARLDRVATSDDAPDAIRLDASGVATGRSRLRVAGLFTGIYGVATPRAPPGIDLEAGFDDAADALGAVLAGRLPAALARDVTIGGAAARLALRFQGPFERVDLDARGSSLTLGYRTMRLADLHFHLAASPLAGRFRLPDLGATSAAGGAFSAAVDLDRLQLSGDLAFDHLATGPLLPLLPLPSRLAPTLALFAGVLDGSVRGRADLAAGQAELEAIALSLTRPRAAEGPRTIRVVDRSRGGRVPRPARGAIDLDVAGLRLAAGELTIPRLSLPLWGGRMVGSGRVELWDVAARHWLPSPSLDLSMSAERIPIQRVLETSLIRGLLSVRARARGSLADLALDFEIPSRSNLTVLGERFELPRRFSMRLAGGALLIPELRVAGPAGSELAASGRIGFSGRSDFAASLRGFPFQRLPGIGQTALPLAGELSGWLRLAGGTGAPAITGQLNIDEVKFQGRAVGGGTIAIGPGPHGGIRARGTLIEAIDADGVLEPSDGGLKGEARLVLQRLRLDPFLSALPGGLTATGVLSGTLTAHVVPGVPPRAQGRLTELTLIVTAPPARRRGSRAAGPPIALHADGEIPLSAQAGDGPISIGPARFRGTAGTFELAGEQRGEAMRGSLRGRIELDGFASLAAPWLERLAGAVDVDLAAASAGADQRVALKGKVSVARPLSLALAGASLSADIPSGLVRVDGDAIETTALPITLRADKVAPGTIGRVEGTGRLTAHVRQRDVGQTVHAVLEIGRVTLELPSLGKDLLRIEGGRIELDDLAATVRALPVRYGDKARLEIGGASTGPASIRLRSLAPPEVTSLSIPVRGDVTGIVAPPATIDRATLAVLLRGSPRGRLRLSGDIEVQAARVAAKGGARAPAGSAASSSASPLDAVDLDLNVRSTGGAVVAEIPWLPDPHLDVDLHLGGTARRPVVTGGPRATGLYSAILLALQRMFR